MAISTDIGTAIARYQDSGTLIGIHCNDQKEDRFFAGYVEESANDRFLLRYVNVGGQPSVKTPTAWFRHWEIDWIDAGSPYLIGLQRLAFVHDKFSRYRESRWRRARRSILRTLKDAESTGVVCRIRFGEENDVLGFVALLARDFVRIQTLDDDGAQSGETLVRLTTISAVRSGGLQEVCLKYLAMNPLEHKP